MQPYWFKFLNIETYLNILRKPHKVEFYDFLKVFQKFLFSKVLHGRIEKLKCSRRFFFLIYKCDISVPIKKNLSPIHREFYLLSKQVYTEESDVLSGSEIRTARGANVTVNEPSEARCRPSRFCTQLTLVVTVTYINDHNFVTRHRLT